MQKCKVNIEAPTQSSQNGDFTGKDMEKQEPLCYVGMDLNCSKTYIK